MISLEEDMISLIGRCQWSFYWLYRHILNCSISSSKKNNTICMCAFSSI